MSRILPLLLLMTAQWSWAACDDALPATGSRNDVLIIVNDNAVDSCEVARYYAEQRDLGRSNILHVKTPANPTISYVEYEILRNQILRGLQQRISAPAASCATPGEVLCAPVLEQLRASSAIRYLVTTKGVPARLIHVAGQTWVQDSAKDEAGSVDGYLRNQLGAYFYPARLDGLNLAAAKGLIDRTLAVESNGWRGKLISAATKNDDSHATGMSRFGAGRYTVDPSVPLLSETLKAGYAGTPDNPGDPLGDFLDTDGHRYWRYQFGLFNETETACTGNTAIGPDSNFYLHNSQWNVAGKAPDACKVRLVKGNGSNPAFNETPPGTGGRMPKVVDAIAYLGHLDGQPALGGFKFDDIKNWTRDAVCTPRLCKDDPSDPAGCRAASVDALKELDTSCIGVADGFIGHNYQSWPLSYFTAWPTDWRPLWIPSTLAGTSGFAEDMGGSDNAFVAYPRVRDDDGDGDSTSLWYGAHDKIADTTCYASDLTTTAHCTDLNTFKIGQKVASVGLSSISGTQYYRLSLSYRSTAGEIAKTAKLAAAIVIQDASIDPKKQKPLPAKLSPGSYYYPLSGSSGDAMIGVDSGSWKRVSAVFKLDPLATLEGTTKQISGMSVNIFSTDNFSGSVGIDAIKLEKVDASEVAEDELTLSNEDFADGHSQFAVGDWAATFTSRLSGVAFWGSTTHNCGGSSLFHYLGDTLADFIGGEPLAAAVWKKETCSGGLLYGDPLYSPVAVKLNTPPELFTLQSGLPISGNVVNGTGSGVTTSFTIEYCYHQDFYTCDRESKEPADPGNPLKGWQSIPFAVAPTQSQGRDISLGTLDTSAIEPRRPFILALKVTSTKAGKEAVFRDFSRVLTAYSATANSDGDSLTDGEEITLGTNPLNEDTDVDLLPDDWEVAHSLDPLVPNTEFPDADGDGLNSAVEQVLGTSDSSDDSDGDGYSDATEQLFGNSYPGNPALQPLMGVAPIPLYAGVGHPYHVVFQKQNGAALVEPLQNLPEHATLVADVFDWTPAPEQVGWHTIVVGPPEVPSVLMIKVIPLDGDLNEDGAFDVGDLMLMEKIVLGAVPPSQKQVFHADYYPLSEPSGVPDGKLDLSDLIVLQKKLLEPAE